MLHLRPSASHRWSKCAAFPRWAESIPPKPDSDPAREGTAAAWVAELVLRGDASSTSDMVGKTHKNGWFITEEMAADVQDYVDLILSRNGEIRAEQEVTFMQTDTVTVSGTLDSSVLSIKGGRLNVDDLKYGRRVVEVYQNPQLVIYAAALVMSLPANTVNLVQLGIYQPRAFHRDGIYRRWVVSVDELFQYAELYWNAALQCASPEPTASPGRWCGDCPVAAKCVALAQTTYAMCDTIQSRHQRDMTSKELARELDFFDEVDAIISARRDAVFAEAEGRAKIENIPGWQMTQRMGKSRFTVDGPMIHLLTGIDPYEKKVVTPAELKRRGASSEVVKQITTTPVIGHKLAKANIDNVFNKGE